MINIFRKGTEVAKMPDETKDESNKFVESGKEIKMAEKNVTNLTSDVEIKGTIKFNSIMKIDGKFEGEMITDDGELIVGKTGSVKANVKVKNAIIEGHVDGNVIVTEKVELRKLAQLIGDLKARTLVIEEGVVFVGNCNVNPDGFKTENTNVREWKRESKKEPG
ncbi:MAG: polymer-forming cytoskeletal protein [Candidatus Brocadia sp.]|nr:polymer-forming cytoskeletal protein [Candidatus Brocadia sp.]